MKWSIIFLRFIKQTNLAGVKNGKTKNWFFVAGFMEGFSDKVGIL